MIIYPKASYKWTFHLLLMQSTKLHSTKHNLSDLYKHIPTLMTLYLKRQFLLKLGFKYSWGKVATHCYAGKSASQEVAAQTNRHRSGRTVIHVHTHVGVTTRKCKTALGKQLSPKQAG